MQAMSTTTEHDSKEPYRSDSDEPEEQSGPPEDTDQEEEEDEEDIGDMTEAERQEMQRLNSQLDVLNVALDEFEQKNSNLQQRLVDFLAQNSARGSDEKPAAVGSDEKPAAVGSDEKPAAVGSDEKPAAVGSDDADDEDATASAKS